MPQLLKEDFPRDDDDDRHIRKKRFVPLIGIAGLLLKGVFGTFHGLYTKQKYDRLKSELTGTIQ